MKWAGTGLALALATGNLALSVRYYSVVGIYPPEFAFFDALTTAAFLAAAYAMRPRNGRIQ